MRPRICRLLQRRRRRRRERHSEQQRGARPTTAPHATGQRLLPRAPAPAAAAPDAPALRGRVVPRRGRAQAHTRVCGSSIGGRGSRRRGFRLHSLTPPSSTPSPATCARCLWTTFFGALALTVPINKRRSLFELFVLFRSFELFDFFPGPP